VRVLRRCHNIPVFIVPCCQIVNYVLFGAFRVLSLGILWRRATCSFEY